MTGLTELPPLNRTRFSPVRVVEETGSTNADLVVAAREGEPEGSVLVTDHQTAGRGRQRRQWHDNPGNALLVSVLLQPGRDVAPLMPLLVGVAAVEALAHLGELRGIGGLPPAGLKWPNDVLAPSLEERKLAGILCESTNHPGSAEPPPMDAIVVVAGMGMNLRWSSLPPPDVAARAATVEEVFGVHIARDEVLDLYLRHLERWLRVIEGHGAAALLDRYRDHCLTLGRQVRFATSETEYMGTATDILGTGTLLLDTAEHGPIELHAGDAHHVA